MWPVSEVATRLIEVRSLAHSELDLLTLSSSHFDPKLMHRDLIVLLGPRLSPHGLIAPRQRK